MQKKQAALNLTGHAADGTVEVTVNARGQLVKAAIDKSFLDDHDFEDLGEYITEAAQAAAKDAAQRVAEMMAPIKARHKNFPSFSDIVDGMPDPADLMPPGLDDFAAAPRRETDPPASTASGSYDNGAEETDFPTVRR